MRKIYVTDDYPPCSTTKSRCMQKMFDVLVRNTGQVRGQHQTYFSQNWENCARYVYWVDSASSLCEIARAAGYELNLQFSYQETNRFTHEAVDVYAVDSIRDLRAQQTEPDNVEANFNRMALR